MPLFPFIPLAAIALQLILAVFIIRVSWLAWVIGPGWIAAGLLVYFLYSRSRALPIREEVFALESAPARSAAEERFRILVPVAGPDQVYPLIPPMLRLAEATRGVVELVHLVAVPDQVPLSDAPLYALAGREGVVEASLYLPSSRNPARGILSQARAGGAKLILLGWRGRPSGSAHIFGSTVDQVLEKSPIDVAVFKPNGKGPFRRVLVPVAGGPNSRRALEIAGMLADPARGTVTALHVRGARTQPLDLDLLVAGACARFALPCDRYASRVISSEDPRREILLAAAEADLVVLGATEGRWRRILSTRLPEDIARSCGTSVVIVKTGRPGRRAVVRQTP